MSIFNGGICKCFDFALSTEEILVGHPGVMVELSLPRGFISFFFIFICIRKV